MTGVHKSIHMKSDCSLISLEGESLSDLQKCDENMNKIEDLSDDELYNVFGRCGEYQKYAHDTIRNP